MFREELPAQCPPHAAQRPQTLEVYRLCKSSPPSSADFDSQAKLGTFDITGKPASLACRAFACSLIVDLASARLYQKMPKLRGHKHIAKLIVDEDAGFVLKTSDTHYDWWISAEYDPIAAVVEVA